MGIWKPVLLHITKGISLNNPLVITSNLTEDYSSADIDILVEFTNNLPQ